MKHRSGQTRRPGSCWDNTGDVSRGSGQPEPLHQGHELLDELASPHHLPDLPVEELLTELVKGLHLNSFNWLTKKEWLVDLLKEGLRKLLDPGRGLAQRFDAFRAAVKGFSAATLTEMLTYYQPERVRCLEQAGEEAPHRLFSPPPILLEILCWETSRRP